jgi:hypothetical protein
MTNQRTSFTIAASQCLGQIDTRMGASRTGLWMSLAIVALLAGTAIGYLPEIVAGVTQLHQALSLAG